MTDEFHGEGGTFEIRDGKRVRVTEPTRDHPDGNRARDEHGKPLDDASPPAGGGVAQSAGVVGEKATPANVKPIGTKRSERPLDT